MGANYACFLQSEHWVAFRAAASPPTKWVQVDFLPKYENEAQLLETKVSQQHDPSGESPAYE